MRITEIIIEGGWASVKTQGTVITPQTIADAVKHMEKFQNDFNRFLSTENIPPIKIGNPVGSGTYYKRDLIKQPEKEYGDIDVEFFIPRIPGMGEPQNERVYVQKVIEFANNNNEYETTNGINVVFQIGSDYIQVDLVVVFEDTGGWNQVFAPEWNYKGVLSSTLFSALAAILNVSISARGIQVKTRDGNVVPFSNRKDVELHTITTNKETWAKDLADAFGAEQLSPRLEKHPGLSGEVKIANIIESIKGILESIGKPELLDQIRQTYLDKIDGIINSSKFDKAESPEAKKKAQDTKQMLFDKSRAIAKLF